jgi:hypothetical protein
LDTFGSFLGAVDLYPAPGVQTHHHLHVFLPFKNVPLSLNAYTPYTLKV